MKDIDVRWVENSKTKKTSLKTISREKYNDYPEGTATVQLENIKSKNSDAKVWFIFEGKNDVVTEWDYQKQARVSRGIVWRTTVQVDLVYKKILTITICISTFRMASTMHHYLMAKNLVHFITRSTRSKIN